MFSSFAIAILALAAIANVGCEYTKFEYTVLSAPAVDIQSVDVTPMPIINPGEAVLTFAANLKRPIRTIRTTLKITRTVSGIQLPIKCYKVNGVDVGSCDYNDLCAVLKTLLPSFQPATCPPTVAQYGIDCNCPFNIPAGQITINKEKLVIPDAQSSIASFMASGDFVIQIDTADSVGPYASVIIRFSVKSARPSG